MWQLCCTEKSFGGDLGIAGNATRTWVSALVSVDGTSFDFAYLLLSLSRTHQGSAFLMIWRIGSVEGASSFLCSCQWHQS
jgi:hypothetical protein